MADVGAVGSNKIRITGMATGMDTDDTVTKMTLGEKYKVDKAKQDKQIIEWKQEIYRDIMSDLNDIKSEYFDVLGANYILSDSKFSDYDVSYGNTTDTSYVNVSASSGALEGSYSMSVKQIAKEATISSTSSMINNISNAIGDVNTWDNASIKINIGGTEKTITLGDVSDMAGLAQDINNKIAADSDLSGNLYFSVDSGNKLKINTMTSSTVKITEALKSDGTTPISELTGLTDNDKVLNPNGSTLLSDLDSDLSGGSIEFNLEYNGTTKNVSIDNSDGSKNIKDVIYEITEATSGSVKASFSELTGKFTLKTSDTGSASSIKVTATGGSKGETLFGASALNIVLDTEKTGLDSKVTITPPGESSGTTVTKSKNTFTIDGVQYNLTKETTSDITFEVNSDANSTFDKVKGFIDKYNEMIEKIYTKVEEKRQYDYSPLTEDQKESMSDEEIERWEERAKEGLLRNDNDLENLLSKLRQTFFDSVEGAGIAFTESQLGIGTSSDIGQRGKIIIKDEAKFKAAIENNGDQITRLFVKSSDISYSRTMSTADKQTRYNEVGIFTRISDILNDYTSTFRDSTGKKGVLVEKAGAKNDVSFVNNTLSQQIQDKQEMIETLTEKLYDKQDYYYTMFAKLETMMNNLNSQSDWLYSQMGM